jgi:hypothetical protein
LVDRQKRATCWQFGNNTQQVVCRSLSVDRLGHVIEVCLEALMRSEKEGQSVSQSKSRQGETVSAEDYDHYLQQLHARGGRDDWGHDGLGGRLACSVHDAGDLAREGEQTFLEEGHSLRGALRLSLATLVANGRLADALLPESTNQKFKDEVREEVSPCDAMRFVRIDETGSVSWLSHLNLANIAPTRVSVRVASQAQRPRALLQTSLQLGQPRGLGLAVTVQLGADLLAQHSTLISSV